MTFSQEISVAKMKTASKRLECTLNDIVLGAVASSVSEYMTERKFPFTNNKINVIYNMKTPPKSKQ